LADNASNPLFIFEHSICVSHSEQRKKEMGNAKMIKPIAATLALALSAITVAQTAPHYTVDITSNNAERDAIYKGAEAIPADRKNMMVTAIRSTLNRPNPIGFISMQAMPNYKSRLDVIVLKERGRWRPIWAIRTESDGKSTCAQVMAHIAKGHATAKQYGVDPDIFSGQFQNWERENRSAFSRGGRGCAGSVV
jgi:hypothetical protein